MQRLVRLHKRAMDMIRKPQDSSRSSTPRSGKKSLDNMPTSPESPLRVLRRAAYKNVALFDEDLSGMQLPGAVLSQALTPKLRKLGRGQIYVSSASDDAAHHGREAAVPRKGDARFTTKEKLQSVQRALARAGEDATLQKNQKTIELRAQSAARAPSSRDVQQSGPPKFYGSRAASPGSISDGATASTRASSAVISRNSSRSALAVEVVHAIPAASERVCLPGGNFRVEYFSEGAKRRGCSRPIPPPVRTKFG